MSDPVFFGGESVPEISLLKVGDFGYLAGSEAHHAVKVKRIRPGETFDLVDGKGLRLKGIVVEKTQEEALEAKASSPVKETKLCFQVADLVKATKLPLRLGLIQALAKGGRDEQAVESAVEIGAMEITPWLAKRCVVQWKGEKKIRQGMKKWEEQIKAAAKQSRRSLWPILNTYLDTRQLSTQIATDPDTLYLLLEGNSPRKIGEVFSAHVAEKTADTTGTQEIKVQVIVGPEGGISEEEIEELEKAGAIPVRLGKSVLRSSSAGPAALAVLGAQGGLWDIECF